MDFIHSLKRVWYESQCRTQLLWFQKLNHIEQRIRQDKKSLALKQIVFD